jgi:hypothetical protein
METKLIENILEQIIGYYDSTRGVGHTYATLKGVLNTKSNMVVLSKKVEYPPIVRDRLVTLWTLNSLKGTKQPLVFDNAVLRELFQSALLRISELKKVKETMKTPLRKILDKLCGELGYNLNNMSIGAHCPECDIKVDVSQGERHHYDLQKELILDDFEKQIQNLGQQMVLTSFSDDSITLTQTK